MALISVHIEPDLNYTGTYTVKVFAIGNPNTPVLQKTYNPPFTGDIDDILTITGYRDYDVKIYADACDSKLVGSVTVDAPDSCGQPRSLTVDSITATTATVRYAAPLTGLPVSGYHWELFQGPTVISSGDTTSLTVNLTVLTASTPYTFRVYTKCSGSVLSTYNIINFTTSSV